jgi:benzodiazapine receptor
LIWHSKHTKKKRAITFFIVQFIFNLSWSFIFFNQHQIAWALVDISILLVLILLTIIVFYRINKFAAFLLIPYFLWVSFATLLNATIWTLN